MDRGRDAGNVSDGFVKDMVAPSEPAASRAQIVTLTMNPALDITTSVDAVRPTDKLRCETTRYDPGGGGINVARVARVLGGPVSAVFPAGGPTGDVVMSRLKDERVPFRHIAVESTTRECFTVNEKTTGRQYRFVLPGRTLAFEEQARCLDELRSVARSARFVVASGSLPPGVPPDFYQRVADIVRELGASFILDTSGGGLKHVSSGVYLLKASVRELRECVECRLATEAEQFAAASEIVRRGCAQAVLVSRGPDGALLVTEGETWRFPAIPMRGGSGVGAGDAMVGAITTGLTRGWPLIKSVRLGIAAGAAMLTTPGTAVCDRADVDKFFAIAPEPAEACRS